ncbi:MAG TPA: hypothetical protein DE312_00635 [Gallionella sp.]|nr:MAG: hypothetical protein A2Z87_02330 [Gallionellales bacterium GWA2_54_124]OGT18153.1 MAG: hypothetical protein A2522_09865 [Gallionellales bacterium RIFOXYD12_FULL_53_10]OGT23705.1 MAG: hypothetical protein A3K00_10135 [Gallionellales bacterium RIFOXYD2_FULL_52_7]HCI51831.1 hypothetical protein [Gallionella sp.]
MEDRMLQENQQLQDEIMAAKRQLSELRQELCVASMRHDPQINIRYLSHLSICDRSLFIERLVQDISRAQRDKRMVAVLRFSLEPYCQIKDEYGQSMAGLLLCTVAERLKLQARAGDTVGHMGENELGLIMPALDNAQAAADFSVRMANSFAHTPLKFGDREVFVHACIGIALYPLDGVSAEIVLKHAETALCHAKEEGLCSMQYYSSRMSDAAGLTFEDVMQRALECGEFVVYYAPVRGLADGRICAMDALIYWQSPEQGMLSPSEFMPQLEKTGLIVPVGAWLLDTVCRQIALWQNDGLDSPAVSISLSALQIRQSDFASLLQTVLQKYGLSRNAAVLELDVGESVLMQDLDTTAGLLKTLKEIGVQIGVADFGTGHSCLNYLKYLSLDTLKIDSVFLRNLPDSRENAAIIKAMITLGLGLGLKVVATGVESAVQLVWLSDARCQGAQGDFIGPPALPDAIAEILKSV